MFGLLVLTMMAGLFAGCGSKQTNVQGTETQSADQGEVVQKTAPPAMEEINDKALNQYNTIYSNYLNSKQQEYENQQAELARQEAIRQYNENLALQ